MNKELEEICVKRYKEISHWTYENEEPMDFKTFCTAFKVGYQETVKPENLKLIPEVQKLVEALEKISEAAYLFDRNSEKFKANRKPFVDIVRDSSMLARTTLEAFKGDEDE